MKTEIKKAWIEALRSGRYEQGRGALKVGDRFCCLGVLCDLYDSSQWVKQPSGESSFDEHILELPIIVQAWAGLEDCNPCVGEDGLIQCNDHQKKTFSEIADLIEKHL